MYSTYYLFIHENYPIEYVFDYLKLSNEEGIKYTSIQDPIILPKYITIQSMFKDMYLKKKIEKVLGDLGYEKPFKILKPLVKEVTLVLHD